MIDYPFPKIVALTGPYGNGKTEIAISLALQAIRHVHSGGSANFSRVALGDLDVLKPYFRSREARAVLEEAGVEVLSPPGPLGQSDLPIIVPELRGYLACENTQVILDIAGDPAGAKALGSLADLLSKKDHDLLLVLNRHRPFCATLDSVMEQAALIAQASQLRITGIVSNTHFMERTTLEDIEWGLDLARGVAYQLGVSVRLLAAPQELRPVLQDREDLPPQMFIHRRMMPHFMGGLVLSPSASSKKGATS